MVVIASYREQADGRIQLRQCAAEGLDIMAHRRRTRKIITGQKHKFGPLAVDRFDRLFEPSHIFVAIEVKIAYLAGDDSMKSGLQMPHRQVYPHDLDFI